MKENTNKVGIVVIAFITLLIAISLLSVLADNVFVGTDSPEMVVNETIVLNNGTAVSLANDWVTGVGSVVADNTTANYTLTETTDYVVGSLNSDNVATITLVNAIYDMNQSYVTYNYQDDNYIRDGTSRVLIRLVVLFFALAIFGIALWAMYQMGIKDFM